MKSYYEERLETRNAEIQLMKEAFMHKFFQIGRKVTTELNADYETRTGYLKELDDAHKLIVEAQDDAAYLEKQIAREAEK